MSHHRARGVHRPDPSQPSSAAATRRRRRPPPSERRVAELAAAGDSNREIATTLFVTVKAVEWHLGNV